VAERGSVSGDMLDIMKRMENLFRGMASTYTQGKKTKEEIDITINLENQLQSAVTSSATVKKLSEVLRRGIGGAATPQIRENLAKAARYRREAQAAKRQLAKMAANPKGTPIQQAMKRADLHFKIAKYRQITRSSLARAKGAALGKGGIPQARSTLAKIATRSRIAGSANALIGAFQLARKSVDMASISLHKFSQFPSHHAIRAGITEEIGDLRRNIMISREIGEDLLKFANASKRAKDAFAGITIVWEKAKIRLGTGILDIVGKVGEALGLGGGQKGGFGGLGNANVGWLSKIGGMFGLFETEELKKWRKDHPDAAPPNKLQGDINKWKPPKFGLNPDEDALAIVKDFQKRTEEWRLKAEKRFDPRSKLKGHQPFDPRKMAPNLPGEVGGPGALNIPDFPRQFGGGRKGLRPDGPGIGGGRPGANADDVGAAGGRARPGVRGMGQEPLGQMNKDQLEKVQLDVAQKVRDARDRIKSFVDSLPDAPGNHKKLPQALIPKYEKLLDDKNRWLKRWDEIDARLKQFEERPVVNRVAPNEFLKIPDVKKKGAWAFDTGF
jgi:hypothetical protein